jgi:hypothetical protein
MDFEVRFQKVDPRMLVLGQSREVEVKYKITLDARKKLKAKFSSKGGFTISGTAEFDHDISSDEEFTKKITLVPGSSVGQLFTLQLEVCDDSNKCIPQTSEISIISDQTAALLASPSEIAKHSRLVSGNL